MLAKKLPRNNVKFRAEVVQIDLEEKVAKTRDDIEIKYKVIPQIEKNVIGVIQKRKRNSSGYLEKRS